MMTWVDTRCRELLRCVDLRFESLLSKSCQRNGNPMPQVHKANLGHPASLTELIPNLNGVRRHLSGRHVSDEAAGHAAPGG
jgi:hypothetical protein